jgi:uncharacterized protein
LSLFGAVMEIDLTQLDTEGVRLSEEFGPGDLAGGDAGERYQPLHARLEVTLRPERGGVRATGDVVATVRVECDRCLKPLEIDVTGQFDQRYVWDTPDAAPVERMVELEELDVERLLTPVLDVAVVAREQIELAAPIRIVCSEDCRGLCETCGADLNTTECGCDQTPVDPRWDALKNLKKQ